MTGEFSLNKLRRVLNQDFFNEYDFVNSIFMKIVELSCFVMHLSGLFNPAWLSV